ncbi:Gmad2 immunoglobulin-like domain-containing protein [Patescibacteria group bacterium]
MKKILKILLIILIIAVVWLCIRFVFGGSEDDWICDNGKWIKHGMPSKPQPTTGCDLEKITNFEECVKAGNNVMESYPRQCVSGENVFVEDIGNELEKVDLIQIDTPRPNEKITSPLLVSGQARGYWFFEGDFPIKLLDANENLITQSIASVQGDASWMTEDFVSFTAQLEFIGSSTENGWLILEKDNPSGLLENADELRVPIKF